MSLILVSLLAGIYSTANADVPFSKFTSANIEMQSPEVCDKNATKKDSTDIENQGASSPLSWHPTGRTHHNWDPACSEQQLEADLLAQGATPYLQAQTIQDYFARCDAKLRTPTTRAFLQYGSTEYHFCANRQIRSFGFKLSSGVRLNALLGIQKSTTPRPLVVIKCGVFCNLGEASHRDMLMHVFDESPFHILAIGNSTGAQFIEENQMFTIGGLDEAKILHDVLAELMTTEGAKQAFSSVHFIGMSLGSHSGFYANQMHGAVPIKSSLNVCPVVDLKASLNDLFTDNVRSKIAKSVVLNFVFKLIQSTPFLGRFFPDKDMQAEQIPEAIAQTALERFQTLPKGYFPAPFNDVEIRTMQDLWQANDFVNFSMGEVAGPILAIGATDDWVVQFNSNAARLARAATRRPRQEINVAQTPSGNHCIYSTQYGWEIASAMYRGFILSQSPELLARRRSSQYEFSQSLLNNQPQWTNQETVEQTVFKTKPKDDKFSILFTLSQERRNGESCRRGAPHLDKCVRTVEWKIPLLLLGDRNIPANEAEADATNRWLNVNLSLLDSQRTNIRSSSAVPRLMQWYSY